jgi:hypothetical protein
MVQGLFRRSVFVISVGLIALSVCSGCSSKNSAHLYGTIDSFLQSLDVRAATGVVYEERFGTGTLLDANPQAEVVTTDRRFLSDSSIAKVMKSAGFVATGPHYWRGSFSAKDLVVTITPVPVGKVRVQDHMVSLRSPGVVLHVSDRTTNQG